MCRGLLLRARGSETLQLVRFPRQATTFGHRNTTIKGQEVTTIMDVLVDRVAALDIGKAELTACVRTPDQDTPGRRRQTVRTYRTMQAGLLTLLDWLISEHVSRVVMEATSDYWKPVYYLLEAAGLEVWLVNAHHVKGVPGRRKTDAIDAAWLAKIAECELVRPSFVPPPPIRQLRDLTRYRTSLTRERTREAQRMEKILEDAGIKLTVVASQILGVSSRAIITALISGQRDPHTLADLAKGQLRRKHPQLVEALTGNFTDHHAFLCQQMLDHIDHLDQQITALDTKITQAIRPYQTRLDQLDTIHGIDVRTAQRLIAEIGPDMTAFPTPGHLTAWARTAPRPRCSAAKTRGGSTGKGNPWLAGVLGEISATIARSPTYLGTRHRRLAARRGTRRAIVATSRHLLIIAWHLLSDPDAATTFHDLGPDYHLTRINTEKRTRSLIHQLQQLGLTVTIEPAT